MLTPDPSSPLLASGPHAEIEAFLATAAAGRSFDGAAHLTDSFVSTASAIASDPAGSLDVVLSSPGTYSTHQFTLARAGVLRRSHGRTDREELGLHPTTTLPGVLLRLVGLSPVDELDADDALDLAPETPGAVFADDPARRTTAWTAVIAAGRALPSAPWEGLEQAEPRAARLVRHRPEGDRAATILLLRGRYLASGVDGAALRGTSSTGAARALMRALLKP